MKKLVEQIHRIINYIFLLLHGLAILYLFDIIPSNFSRVLFFPLHYTTLHRFPWFHPTISVVISQRSFFRHKVATSFFWMIAQSHFSEATLVVMSSIFISPRTQVFVLLSLNVIPRSLLFITH